MQAGQMGAQVAGAEQREFVGGLKGPELALVVGGLTIVLVHLVARLGGAGRDSDDRHYGVWVGAQHHEIADLEHCRCGVRSGGGDFGVVRRCVRRNDAGGIELGIRGRVGRRRHVRKGVSLRRFSRLD